MKRLRAGVLIAVLICAKTLYGANPFLSAADDSPVAADFKGTEWGDEMPKDLPLSARVVTTRLAKMPWGEIYKIEFQDLKSKAEKKRALSPEYFIVTDEQIVLLNEESNDVAVKQIAAMAKPPEFEPGNIYGIAKGKFEHHEGLWETTIEVKGDLCTFMSSHNSGHFRKLVWKKGTGLIEYAGGYGARADGYRLKRAAKKKN